MATNQVSLAPPVSKFDTGLPGVPAITQVPQAIDSTLVGQIEATVLQQPPWLKLVVDGVITAVGTLAPGGSPVVPGSPTVLSSGSWVDLCSSPYNCTPGSDVTSALQNVINDIATAGTGTGKDTTIYFSKPGVYNLNGPQQTGTFTSVSPALTYNYSGQILFPARLTGVHIRIMGTTPPYGFGGITQPETVSGVVLQSNATSGAAFDAIPAYASNAPGGFTFVDVTFENIVVRMPTNPTATAINGQCLIGLNFRGAVIIDTPAQGGSLASSLTGPLSVCGVVMPGLYNWAMCHQSGELGITGFPTGLAVTEHCVFDYLFIEGCVQAIQSFRTQQGHATRFNYCCVQGCNYVLVPDGFNTKISGFFDIGDQAGYENMLGFCNDPNNLIYGKCEVLTTRYGSEFPNIGFPTVGGVNLKLEPMLNKESYYPYDTFTRVQYGSNLHGIGVTDATLHPYLYLTTASGSNAASKWTSAAGYVTSLNATDWIEAVTRYLGSGRPSFSRVVRYKITTGASGYNFMAIIGQVIAGGGGSATGNRIEVSLVSGAVSIIKRIGATATTLATSAAGVVAASTSYTLDVVVSNPISANGAWTITAFLNGIQQVTTTLSAGDAALMADTDPRMTQDGFGLWHDNGSHITQFAVMAN